MTTRFIGFAVIGLLAALAPAAAAQAGPSTGTLVVHAFDTTIPQDISEFCAKLTATDGTFVSQCTFDGEIQFVEPAGDYAVSAGADVSEYLPFIGGTVHVTNGQTADYTAGMAEVAVINAQVVDRATGETVPFVCVRARVRVVGALNAWAGSACGDEFGTVQLGRLPAGTYDLFVEPGDGVHGMQWIGASGGVGRETLAKSFTVAAGQTLWTPIVKLDGEGGITGVVTDELTGHAVTDAAVSVLPTSRNWTGTAPDSTPVDAGGHYTINGLGPYAWPVETVSATHAWQFGTGSKNRYSASTVTVTEGATSTFNPALATGGTLTGTVITHTGTPVANAWVFADNATTGDDVAAWVRTDASGHFTIACIGAQSVKVGVADGSNPLDWYQQQPTFQYATPVTITDGATKTLTIKVSSS